MAKLKSKHASSKAVFSGFRGMCSDNPPLTGGAEDSLNFRIHANGTLEKRYGWKVQRTYNNTVNAYWEGILNEVSYMFTVAGVTIFRSTGEHSSKIVGSISSNRPVSFFAYQNSLYLLTGSEILVYRPLNDRFESVAPYAPLYGYQWNPSTGGLVYEPINLLTPRLRVHYLNTAQNTAFSLPFFAKSIETVRVDNRTVTEYSLNSMGDVLNVPSAANASTVEIAFNMDFVHDVTPSLLQSTIAYVSNDEKGDTVYLSGSSHGYRTFCSTKLSQTMLAYCSVFYSYVDPLYFKASKLLLMGHTGHPIRAFCKQLDHLFAFSEQGVWAIQKDYENDTVTSLSVLSDFGCNQAGAVIGYENDILLLNKSGFFKLNVHVSDPDRLTVQRIQLPKSDRITREWFEHAILFLDPWENEILLRDPSDTTGTVLVRNTNFNEWYFFDGIPASRFFYKDSAIGFINGDTLCVFSKGYYRDGNSVFNAYYRSNYMNFETPQEPKRASRVTLCANFNGDNASLTVETEAAEEQFPLKSVVQSAPECFDRRLSIGRFRHLRFSVTSRGASPVYIYTISFLTKH